MAFLKLLDFIVKISMWLNIMQVQTTWNSCIHLFRERSSEKNVHATIPKGDMGYNQYTVFFWHCSCRTYVCCFSLALANILPWSLVHDSNFFEKQWTQNHPQNLSGLSHALNFPDNLSWNSCKQKAINQCYSCEQSATGASLQEHGPTRLFEVETLIWE